MITLIIALSIFALIPLFIVLDEIKLSKEIKQLSSKPEKLSPFMQQIKAELQAEGLIK
jgi:hypothetical protein